jgi:hypothetical protein
LPDQIKIPQGDRDQVLVNVAGEEVRASDLFQYLFVSFNPQTTRAIQQCVLNVLVAKEAARIGARIPEAEIATEQDRALADQKQQFQQTYKGSISFDEAIRENLGMTPEAYAALWHRAVLQTLFLERVVRYELRRDERRVLRVLVVADKAKAESLRHDLELGADFDTLARRESVHPSRDRGGLLPALPVTFRSGLTDGGEELSVGGVSQVLEFPGNSGTMYKVVKVIEILPGDARPYAEQEETLLAELKVRPLDELEVIAGSQRMFQRYPVKYLIAPEALGSK